LYCDEGPGVGLGHRARCEAIAAALRARGLGAAVLATNDGIVAAPVVVVDSYRLRADDRHHFVPDIVVAIDDLERDMAVDCIVAPSPGARADVYRNAATVLTGARYALIAACEGAPSLRATAREHGGARQPVVLVATGASDRNGIGAGIARALRALRPDVIVRLVVGPWGSTDVPDGVEAVIGASGLAPVLRSADVVVTAGGVTLLEALHLGRPCVAFAIAANQEANVAAVGTAGAAVITDVGGAARAAATLVDDSSLRAVLSVTGAALVDGQGAARVADVILATMAQRGVRAEEVCPA
jgi:spore coat polysaccharide biosynthesis predicted glycosyltransferase SpsG